MYPSQTHPAAGVKTLHVAQDLTETEFDGNDTKS